MLAFQKHESGRENGRHDTPKGITCFIRVDDYMYKVMSMGCKKTNILNKS